MIVQRLKATSIIPPAVALAIAGTWLGTQRQSVSTLEQQSAVLRKAIAARSSRTTTDSPQETPTSPAKATPDQSPLDWKKIAGDFTEARQGQSMGDMRTMMHLHQRLQALDNEELITALDEIAALDCAEDTRNMLEQMILGPLVEKDPELALTKFIDRLHHNNGSLSWQLSHAMGKWSKRDPAAATAWLDKQIAAGKFDSKSLDGRSQSRIQFEGSLIRVLLSSDPAAAGRRLAGMPEDQRDDALSQFSFQQLKGDDQLAFAELVREQVAEKEQARTLAQQASRLVDKGSFAKVTEFLDRIQATPAERATCVEQAAESGIRSIAHRNKVTRDDLDKMREWVNTQTPQATDRLTGKALANAMQGSRKLGFSEAAELAMEYHDSSSSDDVLASFLDGWPARQNKDQARILAAKISDAKRREEILENLK